MGQFSTKDMNNGFHMKFDNGVTVSVQFGAGNYCANRDEPWNSKRPSPTAEIGMWTPDGRWITDKVLGCGDDVQGWLTPNDVLDAMRKAADYEG